LDQWSEGLSIASGAATGLGVGLGFVSTQLEAAGLEEGDEIVQTLSSAFTFLGVVLGFIPPILKILGDEALKA
jgi:hypothetical protein